MEDTKPFKTYRQQLRILRARGLEVPTDGKAKQALERIGYYTLINGYKHLFLARDSYGNIIHPEKFIPGASFREIVALYDLDKELRSILYDGLLAYETTLGAEISYCFSEKYPEKHAYLAMDNFSTNPNKLPQILKTISSLSSTINRKASERRDNAIKHYVNNHRHVPLWVLVNFLTFGDLNYFYSNCTEDVKVAVAKAFTKKRKEEYGIKKTPSLTPDVIETINHMVNHFRNAVAHNEIIYSKYIYKSARLKPIKSMLNDSSLELQSQAGVFELIMSLKLVLDKREYTILIKKMKSLLDSYQYSFQSVSFDGILQDMHIPQNYSEYL